MARKALRSAPTAATNLLAGIALKRGNLDSAQKYLARALHDSPDSMAIRLNLVHVARQAGNTDLAAKHLDVAAAQSSGDAVALRNLASIYRELGRVEEAVNVLERSLEISVDSETLAALALAKSQAGSLDEALPYALSAIAMGKPTAQIHFTAGRAYLENGNNCLAADCFENAVSLDRYHSDALIGLSIAKARLNEIVAAKLAARRALDVRPFVTTSNGQPELRVAVTHQLANGRFNKVRFGADAYASENFPSALNLDGVRFDHFLVDLTRSDQKFDVGQVDIVLNNVVNGQQLAVLGALEVAKRACESFGVEVVNPPEFAVRTTRQKNHDAFKCSDRYIYPKTMTFNSIGVDRLALADQIIEEIGVPVIVRPSETQMSRGAELCRTEVEVRKRLESWNHYDICAIKYYDFVDGLGNVRQYRIASVGGVLYPDRLNVSPRWHSHRGGARSENGWYENGYDKLESLYLSEPEIVLGANPAEIFKTFTDRIGLDIFGIDFGIDKDGRIVIFEVNATMNLFNRKNDALCPYKAKYSRLFQDNVRDYLMQRSGR